MEKVLKLTVSALLLAIACAISGCSIDYHTELGWHGKTSKDNNLNYRNSTTQNVRRLND